MCTTASANKGKYKQYDEAISKYRLQGLTCPQIYKKLNAAVTLRTVYNVVKRNSKQRAFDRYLEKAIKSYGVQ